MPVIATAGTLMMSNGWGCCAFLENDLRHSTQAQYRIYKFSKTRRSRSALQVAIQRGYSCLSGRAHRA